MAPVLSEPYPSVPPTLAYIKASTPREESLRHVRIKLDAKRYLQRPFALNLLTIIRKLRISSWSSSKTLPEDLNIHKVSGALTNSVFFVSSSSPTATTTTLLLRVYGPSTSSLLSRTRELSTLHLISSRYNIGPRVYGTFENGRIEQYFDSVPLTALEMREREVSEWIAARMAELHSVDLRMIDDIADQVVVVDGSSVDDGDLTPRVEIARNVRDWIDPAQRVLALEGFPENVRSELDLGRFRYEWDRYLAWVLGRSKSLGMRRVFAHNDTQYGNLLRLKEDLVAGVDDKHRQIIVVDFEYAGANPAAYDIANHFHEWTTNYHAPTSPHKFYPSKYPTPLERRNFYASYINHSLRIRLEDGTTKLALMMEELDRDVEALTPASHAAGVLWGIIQAREDVLAGARKPDFDYVSYAQGRMVAFRRDLKKLGIIH